MSRGGSLLRFLFILLATAMMMTNNKAVAQMPLPQGWPALEKASVLRLSPADLPGWADDDHLAAWQVFKVHCAARLKGGPVLREGTLTPAALMAVCQRVSTTDIRTAAEARVFFENHFDAFDIRPLTESGAASQGFLTGYYEPETTGSLTRTPAFEAPLLARPDDLVTIPQGETWRGIPEGFAAARRNSDGSHSVYPNRVAIWNGDLDSLAKPILWLKDDVEVFFMQVQGSGRVRLPDGRVTRIAYAGRNGHPYSSIGRIMVREGLLPLEDATLDKLKAWLRANPIEAKRIMGMNESYVFFRLAEELSEASGPIGGAGLPLTPWRSIAVDRSIWAYGLPIWLDVALPRENGSEPFQRLTVAEDTGSAILGPARADLYHGSGAQAGSRAGVLRHPMRFVVFWPKS